MTHRQRIAASLFVAMLILLGIALALMNRPVPTWSFEKVKTFPHDSWAFTQGLEVFDGAFIEGTGLPRRSTLRRIDIETGRVLQKIDLPETDFGEGITVLDDKIYQLTWKAQRGYVYDAKTFKKLGEFSYPFEGWGLTHDANSLILSDGTNEIRFIDPKTFKVTRSIHVLDEKGEQLTQINELEMVRGELYANIWMTNQIAKINPDNGKLLGWIDLTGLAALEEKSSDPDGVLNGIAYDLSRDRLFVTGKLWSKVFEIKVKK